MNYVQKMRVLSLASVLAFVGSAFAVAPVWVEPAFVAGQAQLTDIIGEIAPLALVVVALLVGFRLVISMFRKSAS